MKILKLFTATLMLILIGALPVMVRAQEPLPLPNASGLTAARSSDVYFGARINEELYHDTAYIQFTALDVTLNQPGVYRLRFKNNATGVVQTFKFNSTALTPIGEDNETINLNLAEAGVLGKLQNRANFTVWVTFTETATGKVYRTANMQTFVARALPVKLISPAKNALTLDTKLTWIPEVDSALSYRVIVWDVATGQQIFNQPLVPGACSVDQCGYTVPSMLLQTGKTYRWMVRTIGFESATANSPKRTFLHGYDPSAP